MKASQIEIAITGAVVAFILIVTFCFQGSRGLWEPDEGQCASTAAEMMDTNEWLIPQLHHRPILEKPPFMYWGMIAGMKLFGRNEWAVRAIFALCHALTAFLVGVIGCDIRGRHFGLTASLVYSTLALPAVASNIARADATLALATTLSLYCFWKSVSQSGHAGFWKMALCASFGFGFMCKGPAALVLAAPMFVYLLIMGKTLQYFLARWTLPGFLLFAFLGLSWYVYMAKMIPGAAAEFWDNQAWGRLISTKYKRNPGIIGGLRVYVPAMIWGSLPWALIALWNVILYRIRTFQALSWSALKRRPEILLFLLWITIPLTILFFASSKLPLYVLPLFPAIALLITMSMELNPKSRENTGRPALKVILISACMGVVILSSRYITGNLKVARNSAMLWSDAKERIPAGCNTIVTIDEHLDGLGFYSGKRIVAVTTSAHPYPTFSTPLPIDYEIELIASTFLPCAIITNRRNYAMHIGRIKQSLSNAHLEYKEYPIPYNRTILICNSK